MTEILTTDALIIIGCALFAMICAWYILRAFDQLWMEEAMRITKLEKLWMEEAMLITKLENRPLTIERPTGEQCPNCFGTGVVRGAASSYTCGECGGLGLIKVDQDYFVDLSDALASALISERRENAELKRINSELQSRSRLGSRID